MSEIARDECLHITSVEHLLQLASVNSVFLSIQFVFCIIVLFLKIKPVIDVLPE